ncbi:hypothetical protein GGP73_002120 [Salinibacter ruber]|nr:hypothetical protein [Salinibacter ruber]
MPQTGSITVKDEGKYYKLCHTIYQRNYLVVEHPK